MKFMKIEFLKADSLDVVFTKDSNELKSVINVISRVGTEINLNFSENDFIHGYVSNVIYNVDAVNNEECLQICIDKNYLYTKRNKSLEPVKLESNKLEASKLETAKLKESNL